MTILTRVARLLDLDHPTAGERTTWTVRTAHGVHSVELEQALTGTRVRLDGELIGRSDAWSFPDEPQRFSIEGSGAILVVRADTSSGTVRASLLVGGEPIPQDVPAWRRRPPPPVPWRRIALRTGRVIGAALVAGAALGDPFRGWVSTALGTAVDVVWLAAGSGIDVFGVVPAWVHAVTASRAAMLLAGLELLALLALAGDGRIRRRVPLLRSGSRWGRGAGWILLVLAAALLPTLLDP